MLVSKSDIREVLEVSYGVVNRFLQPFRVAKIISGDAYYDLDKKFLEKLRKNIIIVYNKIGLNDSNRKYTIGIIDSIINSWDNPINDFVLTKEEIRDILSLDTVSCDKLLSRKLDKYKVCLLPKTYLISEKFLETLSKHAKNLDIRLSNSAATLYKLVATDSVINPKAEFWTEDMLMCRDRECKCEGCFYENFFTPYDPNFGLMAQSPKVCHVKEYVAYAIKHGITYREDRLDISQSEP